MSGALVVVVRTVAILVILGAVWWLLPARGRGGDHSAGADRRGRHLATRPIGFWVPLAVIGVALVVLVAAGAIRSPFGGASPGPGDVDSTEGSPGATSVPATTTPRPGPQPTGPVLPGGDGSAEAGADNGDGPLPSTVAIRGVYGRDSTPSGLDALAAAGFNTVTVLPDPEELDELADRGLRGLVWLGDYGRGDRPCTFELDDEEVRERVSDVAGHPAIAAYYIADEPSIARANGCPGAVETVRARSSLIRSVDPSVPTFMTLTTWDGRESFPFQYWTGVADVVGLVVYPCFQGRCDFGLIERAVEEAEGDGLGEYWAVVQDFSDAWYDLPDASALERQLRLWSRSRMTGYLLFAAGGFSCCQGTDFEGNAEKRRVLERWNA